MSSKLLGSSANFQDMMRLVSDYFCKTEDCNFQMTIDGVWVPLDKNLKPMTNYQILKKGRRWRFERVNNAN